MIEFLFLHYITKVILEQYIINPPHNLVLFIVCLHIPILQDYKPEWDPSKFHSEKTGRGPLSKDWKEKVSPSMCCYKLVTCEFKWWGLQGQVESRIQKVWWDSSSWEFGNGGGQEKEDLRRESM